MFWAWFLVDDPMFRWVAVDLIPGTGYRISNLKFQSSCICGCGASGAFGGDWVTTGSRRAPETGYFFSWIVDPQSGMFPILGRNCGLRSFLNPTAASHIRGITASHAEHEPLLGREQTNLLQFSSLHNVPSHWELPCNLLLLGILLSLKFIHCLFIKGVPCTAKYHSHSLTTVLFYCLRRSTYLQYPVY